MNELYLNCKNNNLIDLFKMVYVRLYGQMGKDLNINDDF